VIDHWKKTLIPETATIADVIRNLDESMVQIALVIRPEGHLVGTLTDGDIRRGLLHGLELTNSVETIINKEPLVVTPEMNRETVLQLMQINKIHQLPVVNENRCVVGLHSWNELIVPGERKNVMVIMAGGQGTRLRPHTENCPKPLLPVGGKPMLEHIIERAKAEGFHNFILSIHYLGHMIEDYFTDGSKWQVNIDYVREEQPLGTAGALSLLNPRPNEPFLVSNGDVLTDVHYGELLDFHSSHSAFATMAVRQHEWQHPFGVVRTKGVDIVGFDEKPITHSHINAGIYVLEPEVLDGLKEDEYCDMPTLFNRQQDMNKRTIVYPMHEPWLDVGRIDDLHRARQKHSIEN
jgi:dTDP-glucose pyrophosphorylase